MAGIPPSRLKSCLSANDPLRTSGASLVCSMSTAKLLSEPTNYAVVHLPGRAFPGVVFQGDSLDSLIGEIEEAAAATDPDERTACLEDIIERLRAVQTHYETVLGREGMELPYSKS